MDTATREQALAGLLKTPGLWRGRIDRQARGEPTGHPELDRLLPGRGWPRGALIELLPEPAGIGELSLLLPTLARCGRQAWVAPPHLPYAPALAAAGLALDEVLIVRPQNRDDALWAMEQVLRGGLCLVGWHEQLPEAALRRLQLAAEDAGTRAFLFRPPRAARGASPAALRLRLTRGDAGLVVEVLKCRGGKPGRAVIANPGLT